MNGYQFMADHPVVTIILALIIGEVLEVLIKCAALAFIRGRK